MRGIISRIMTLIIFLLALICSLCILIRATSARDTAHNAITSIVVFSIVAISLCVVGALDLRARAVSTTMRVTNSIVLLASRASRACRRGVLAVNVLRTFLETTTTGRNRSRARSSRCCGCCRKSFRRWLSCSTRVRNIRFFKGRGDVGFGHIAHCMSSGSGS